MKVTVVTVRVRTRAGDMNLIAGVAADPEAVQTVIANDRALRAGRPLLYGERPRYDTEEWEVEATIP